MMGGRDRGADWGRGRARPGGGRFGKRARRQIPERRCPGLVFAKRADLPGLAVEKMLFQALGLEFLRSPAEGNLFDGFDFVFDGPVERVREEVLRNGGEVVDAGEGLVD